MSATLPLHQLETLVAVVDERGFEAAARRLRITPPAVSQRIRALEQSVGRTLLHRTIPPEATEPGERLLPFARRMVLLAADAAHAVGLGDPDADDRVVLPLAVNADSLATWFLDAVASAPGAGTTSVHLERADQDHTAQLLLTGRVVGAVSTAREPVHGCTSTALGVVRYLPLCTPSFAAAHALSGARPAGLAGAPRVDYDTSDGLQAGFLRRVLGHEVSTPQHRIPGSGAYVRAVEAGLGWGLVPEEQARPGLAAGRLVALAPGEWVDVPLFWQRLELPSTPLDRFSAHVTAFAARRLRPPH